jgi:hypothetical protein
MYQFVTIQFTRLKMLWSSSSSDSAGRTAAGDVFAFRVSFAVSGFVSPRARSAGYFDATVSDQHLGAVASRPVPRPTDPIHRVKRLSTQFRTARSSFWGPTPAPRSAADRLTDR